MKQRNLIKEIKIQQIKLNEAVEKYGLSGEKTIQLSAKIDEMINYYMVMTKEIEYPKGSKMAKNYETSKKVLRRMLEADKRISVEKWNEKARQCHYLSSESMKYISQLDWKYLKIKLTKKLNLKEM